jgi:hypothetical protein
MPWGIAALGVLLYVVADLWLGPPSDENRNVPAALLGLLGFVLFGLGILWAVVRRLAPPPDPDRESPRP